MKFTKMVLKNSKMIIFICVLLMIAGVYSYIAIPKQKMPDSVPPVGSYQIVAPGFTAEEVYEHVVKPMERVILGIEDVDSVVANTYDNFALVNIILDVKYPDPEEMWAEITLKIKEINFPDGVLELTFRSIFDFPHAVYSVSSKTANIRDIEIVAEMLANEIRDIEEIKSVDTDGMSKEYLQITVDIKKLDKYLITIKNITDVLTANGMSIPIGKIESEGSSIGVDAPMIYKNIDDVDNLVIGVIVIDPLTNAVEPVYLKDVAQIEVVSNKGNKTFYVDEKEATFVSAYFKEGLDITKLGDDLTEIINDFRLDNEEFDIDVMIFQPDYVSNSMDEVNNSLVQGLIFVLIIILIGLGYRNAISIAFTFPLIIFATVLGLFISGQQLQIISITGLIITIGIIVDNSIVISESIQHYLDQGRSKKKAVSIAIKKNAMPVLAATFTTIAAFIPLLLLPGVIGKMMFALPLTVIIAISLSYIVAMVVTPILGAKLYVKTNKKASKKAKKRYVKILNMAVHGSLRRPVLVISISIIALICSLTFVILKQPVKLFPSAEDSIVYINYEYTGTLDKTVEEYAKEIVDTVKTYNDIEYLAYSVGGDLPRFDSSVSSLNELPTTGRVYARFDIPYSKMEALMIDLEKDLEYAQFNGKVSVQELMLGPTSDEIEIILSSKDMDETTKLAKNIEEKLQYIDGIKSYHIAYPNYQKKYIVELDRNKIAQNGSVAIDVQMQMRDYLTSTINGEYIPNGEKMDIVLKTNIDSIEKLASSGIYIQSKMGKVALNELGEITSKESLYTVSTKDGDYQITISVNSERGIDSILLQGDIDEAIDNIDSGNVDIAYGGEKEIMVDSFVELGIAAIVALLLIYVIMLIQFKSFLQPLVVLTTIPLSLIGSGIVAIIFNANISFTMVFGAIALMGIVVNAGILLIDYINKAREKGVDLKKACYKSVERRIRPITLSSVTTIFGLIPLAIYGGEFFNPMAVTLIGGLATSTLLTIFVIPSLYYLIEKRHEKKPQKR